MIKNQENIVSSWILIYTIIYKQVLIYFLIKLSNLKGIILSYLYFIVISYGTYIVIVIVTIVVTIIITILVTTIVTYIMTIIKISLHIFFHKNSLVSLNSSWIKIVKPRLTKVLQKIFTNKMNT